MIFGLIVGQLLGNGLAWFSIVLAGAVGNGLNALIQGPQHAAVGASTAVFGALGLLGAYVWRRRRDLEGRWALKWAPIVGVVVLLAWTGSGDQRTDIIAHLTGFGTGLAMGVYYGAVKIEPGPVEPAAPGRGRHRAGRRGVDRRARGPRLGRAVGVVRNAPEATSAVPAVSAIPAV